MIYLMFYILFCLATGVTSIFTIHIPLKKILAEEDLYLIPGHSVFFVLIMTILAPLVFITVITGVSEELVESVMDKMN